jgi:hypothetical protein
LVYEEKIEISIKDLIFQWWTKLTFCKTRNKDKGINIRPTFPKAMVQVVFVVVTMLCKKEYAMSHLTKWPSEFSYHTW